MKKIMKSLLLLIIIVANVFNSSAQVTLGDESLTNGQTPINPSKEYSYSQMIYLAEDINTSGAISAIKFTKSGVNLTNSDDWTIYLGHTSNSSFEGDSSWVDIS